jgi:glycosyltransferase involved in cell wall biosynthesis
MPTTTVYVVEENPELASTQRETIERSGIKNLFVFENFEDLADSLAKPNDAKGPGIALLKVELDYCSALTLERIADLGQRHPIGYLCGEYSESRIDPLTIFRTSRKVSSRYFWRNASRATTMTGQAHDGRPEVSVVVPMYQVKDYIGRCLESLSKQTLCDREILIMDDESTDGSAEIARQWAARDSTFQIIRQENQGCAAARSNGLARATGLFVGFVDGDDWVETDMLERLLRAAVANGAEIAQGGYREVYEADGVEIVAEERFSLTESGAVNQVVKELGDLMTLKPTIWRRLYRTSFLRSRQLDFHKELRRFDDLPFQFETLMNASVLAVEPGVFYNYRLGRMGQDVGATDERLFIHFRIFELLRNAIARRGNSKFERSLRQVQLNTHHWGHQRLEAEFKQEYLVRAARDLLAGRMMLTRLTTLWTLWRQARAPGARRWLLRVFWLGLRHGYIAEQASTDFG